MGNVAFSRTRNPKQNHPSQLPKRSEAKSLVGQGGALAGFPLRVTPGMVPCPKRNSHLALMRCGEYQAQGCTCQVQATPQELVLLKSGMQWQDRHLPGEPSLDAEDLPQIPGRVEDYLLNPEEDLDLDS